MPWIIRWPGHVEPGRRVRWPCSQLDVTPTILNLVGFDITSAGLEGLDALGPPRPDRRLYFSTWSRRSPLGSVQGSRKVIYWPYTDTLLEYDLAADPGEQHPRKIEGPQRQTLAEEFVRWRDGRVMSAGVKRFRERLLYDHWRAFSSGRSSWAYYVSSPSGSDS